jgi:hypothetical protein
LFVRYNTQKPPLLACVLLAICCAIPLWAIEVEVDLFTDSAGSVSNCGATSGSCNLRSAWEYCLAQSANPCLIRLPANTHHTFEVNFGELEIIEGAAIEVIGNGATVTLGASRRLLSVSRGDELQEHVALAHNHSRRLQIYSASDFPFTMRDFSGSNNAYDVYEVACVQACPFDILNFHGCDGDTEQDTYFRLYRGDTEVASNDDTCGYSSSVTYMVPSGGQCEDYCIHMGCFGNDPCGTTVTFSQVTFNDASQFSTSSRLFNVRNVNSTDTASLTVRSLTVQSFGDSYIAGGSLYAEGSVRLLIEDCAFSSSAGYLGGALFINNVTTSDVVIANTTFTDTHARQGGAIYVGIRVDNMILMNCTFDTSSSDVLGGAIYVGTSNRNMQIAASVFVNCSAVSDGGGILIDDSNDEISIFNCSFSYCSSFDGGGGGIALLSNNNRAELRNNTFESCSAWQVGGAVYARDLNADLLMVGATMTHCTSSTFAAGLAMMERNARARIENISVVDCTADWKGGGILLLTENINVTLSNVNITRCRGSKGGGMLIDTGNSGLVLQHVHVTDCAATGHAGGIYIGRANHLATLRDSSISGCRALSTDGDGGCLYVDTQNQGVVLERITLSRCSARNGGGLYAEVNHNLLLRDVEVSWCGARWSGGGINLHGASAITTLLGAKIMHNTALVNGGGIFSSRLSEELTIASSAITSNSAMNGGGIYVEIGNPHFSVLDARTYETRVVLESAHPYEYIQTTHNVQVDGALGYYVYFSTQTRTATQDRVSIVGTTTWYMDSNTGYWPGINVPAVYVPDTEFRLKFECYQDSYNAPVTAAQGYFGYKLYAIPVFAEGLSPTNVSSNNAVEAGGGLYFFSGVSYPVVMHARVESNVANDGGGLYLRNAVTGMILYGSILQDNTARLGHGGAVTVSSACQALQFVRCSFTNNRALGSGGAVAFITNNGNPGGLEDHTENHIRECTFEGNNGTTSGGAVFLDLNNTLLVTGSTFVNGHTDGDGGALATSQGNYVSMQGGTIRRNYALGCGGGIVEGSYSALVAVGLNVAYNYAGQFGGGICMRTDSTLNYFNTRVESNAAQIAGGGVACFGSKLPSSNRCEHIGNTAGRGSAFYFNSLNQQVATALRNISMVNNSAASGTIYWVAGSMGEPNGLNATSLKYNGNTVEYGSTRTATQAVRMHHLTEHTVDAYGPFLGQSIEIRLTDYYGEYVRASSPAKVYVNIQNPSVDQCSGRYPFLSGADVSADGVPFVDGVATLASVDVSCNPGGKVTLLITAALEDLALDLPEEAQRTMKGTIELSFRKCVAGEIIINGKCVACPAGSYSLETDVTASTTCTECLSLGTVDSCYADQIFLADGYWRRYPTSEAIIPCLDELSGCGGGNYTGDAGCVLGYEGPLCSLCSEGYYRSDKKCILCVDRGHMSPAAVFFSTIGAAGVITTLAVVLYKLQSKGGLTAMLFIIMANIAAWFKKEARDMKVQLKILTTTFQITSTIPIAMEVAFPPQFARYLSAMSVFNLNVMSVVPVDCANAGGYNFIDKLVMITLAPIGLSLLLLLACTVEYSYRSLAYKQLCAAEVNQDVLDAQEKKLSKVVARYLTLFFLLTYLVLPFIATTIFRTFLCTDLDPDNEDSDAADLYLTADMRISCTSDFYKSGLGYAVVMIVVYVLGIPVMYLVLLYRSRKEIMERFLPLELPPNAVDEDGAKNVPVGSAAVSVDRLATPNGVADDSADALESSRLDGPVNQLQLRHDHAARDALMISFLYEAYEPQFWYWEVVETTRRLMLTAVLSVCGPGTSGQALFAVLLSLMYIKLYGYYAPYTKVSDDVLAESGQFQIFLSFLGALVYQRHLLGDEWNNTIGIVLILINTTVLALFVYFACTNLFNEVKHANINRQLAVRASGDVVKPAAVMEVSIDGDKPGRKDLRKVYIAADDNYIELLPQQGGDGGGKSDPMECGQESGRVENERVGMEGVIQ